jgi:hypothetical protein
MPMIALTAFYCLDRLAREAREQEELSSKPAIAIQAEETARTPAAEDTQRADSSDADATTTDGNASESSSAPAEPAPR